MVCFIIKEVYSFIDCLGCADLTFRDLYVLGMILSDFHMIGAKTIPTGPATRTITSLFSTLSYGRPPTSSVSELMKHVEGLNVPGSPERAAYDLGTNMNYYRFFWKYNLPEPERYRENILTALEILEQKHLHRLYLTLLVPYTDWRPFEAMMLVMQYMTEGIVTVIDQQPTERPPVEPAHAIDLFLGFIIAASESFSTFTGEREVLGGFSLMKSCDWFEKVKRLGTPDVEAGSTWCELIQQLIAKYDQGIVKVANILYERYPSLAVELRNSLNFLNRLPDGPDSHSNVVLAIIAKPLLVMIGGSLTSPL